MFEISRSSIVLFGLQVRWYGVLIALGVLGAVIIAQAREKRLHLPKDTTLNLALICVPVGVVCARLYYVLFNWSYFAAHPAEIINLRSGGLAVYGAVIGGAAAAYLYTRIKKLSFGAIADLVAPGLAFGQALGRWGNFLNQEAYGALVENPALHFFPLATYIEGSGWHYAAFFYESIWCALICASLLAGERKNFFIKRGDLFFAYAFLYALERSIVEGLRTDSLFIGPFRVSQLLSFAVLMAVVILMARRLQGRRLSWRCFRLAALTVLFGITIWTGRTLLSILWALLLIAGVYIEYKSITTNDKM